MRKSTKGREDLDADRENRGRKNKYRKVIVMKRWKGGREGGGWKEENVEGRRRRKKRGRKHKVYTRKGK